MQTIVTYIVIQKQNPCSIHISLYVVPLTPALVDLLFFFFLFFHSVTYRVR